ncbi:MAG: 16S rRNA (uracil(1498)-N(3))-methyltransferase [Pseudomonadota bacterium]
MGKSRPKGHSPGSRSAPRLFVGQPLSPGTEIPATPEQTHYLLAVMRREPGDPVILFNGIDGEWSGHIARAGRRECVIAATTLLKAQAKKPDLTFLFAPLKHARLDYLVQKATELGAGRIAPVITRHTIASRVNTERMMANVIEASEQCGALWVPDVEEPKRLIEALDAMSPEAILVFCDEAAPIADPVAALSEAGIGPIALLIGPEGGFSVDERDQILKRERLVRLSLGPRILRADTAGVAALTLIQAVRGDWHDRT